MLGVTTPDGVPVRLPIRIRREVSMPRPRFDGFEHLPGCRVGASSVYEPEAGAGTAGGAPLIIHCTGSLRLQSRPATIAMLVPYQESPDSRGLTLTPQLCCVCASTRPSFYPYITFSQGKTLRRSSVPASLPSIICMHAWQQGARVHEPIVVACTGRS